MKLSLISLYIFNLVVGNFILFCTEGKKETLLNAFMLQGGFSISSVIFLIFLIYQFRKRASYLLLFLISLFVALLIPVVGSFIFGAAISILNSDFNFNIGLFVFSLVAVIASIPFWAIMGTVNFAILVWYKRQFDMKLGR